MTFLFCHQEMAFLFSRHHEMVILNSRHHERAIAGDPGQYKDGLPRSLSELAMTDRGRM